jgi:acyl-CoA synthetase (AMP-forming)/AMP-acid ligase II
MNCKANQNEQVERVYAPHSAASTLNLSPAALLDLFEDYEGAFLDLDEKVDWDGSRLRAGRDELCRELRSCGVAAGQRILIAVGNGPAFLISFISTLAVGGSPVLLHFETPPDELKRLAAAYGARFALTETWSTAQLTPVSLETKPIAIGGALKLVCALMDDGESDGNPTFPSIPSVPLHPTSGTTGTPKIAIRHGEAAVGEALHYQQTMGITANDALLCVVPMSHAYGFGTCVTMPLTSGASVVSSRRFQPHLVMRAFGQHRITTFPAVPAMLHLLLVAARGPIAGLPGRVLSAGAPLGEQTAKAFFEHTGQAVQSLYGSTETGGIAIDVKPPGIGIPGSVGPAMEPVSVEIRPLDNAEELREGVGRVRVKSASMMAGYLTRDGIDSSHIVDGWFETGDLGFLDDSGRIHLVGRESEVINVFGLKVIPSEVEAVLMTAPGVTDVKVYAGQHRSGSQIVKAAVAGAESLDVGAIREYCTKQLVGYKRPEVITRMETLPRTPTGKIIRDQLP